MSILTRAIASIVMIFAYGWINYLLNPIATLGAGKIAGKQFEASDVAYITSKFGMDFFSHLGLPFVILLAGLVWLWWKPAKEFFNTTAAVTIALLVLIPPTSSRAYYDKTDYTENYFILPNESAFYIPDVGNNKDDQAKFGSESYLASNKIPAKRFNIPHVKLDNSGLWSNYYVPAGRLIVVDRTPFSREWVAQAHRGTSTKDESFPCQSKEGLDVATGVAIGTSVSEENSAKFLYNFGVLPPRGDRTDPAVIFTSVFFGRSLTQVMDGPVRNKIQSLVCNEFTSRTLDDANVKAKEMMDNIEKATTAYLNSVGITLSYMGWADTFTFNDKVQDAINRRYITSQEVAIASILAPHVGTLQGLANAEAVRTVSNKWNGQVPQSVSLWWLPDSISSFVTNLVNPKK